MPDDYRENVPQEESRIKPPQPQPQSQPEQESAKQSEQTEAQTSPEEIEPDAFQQPSEFYKEQKIQKAPPDSLYQQLIDKKRKEREMAEKEESEEKKEEKPSLFPTKEIGGKDYAKSRDIVRSFKKADPHIPGSSAQYNKKKREELAKKFTQGMGTYATWEKIRRKEKELTKKMWGAKPAEKQALKRELNYFKKNVKAPFEKKK